MRILALSPHTDDIELGCGGSLARWYAATKKVVAFSDCDSDELCDEFLAATKRLGVDEANCFHYPRRQFHEHRQEILQQMIGMREEFDPDLVLAPSVMDAHQDHQVIAAEAFRAFRGCSLWAYELPWNHETFSTRAFVRLDERYMESKCDALAKYETQLRLERDYFDPEFVRGLARVRGVQIGSKYAEAFDVVREVR